MQSQTWHKQRNATIEAGHLARGSFTGITGQMYHVGDAQYFQKVRNSIRVAQVICVLDDAEQNVLYHSWEVVNKQWRPLSVHYISSSKHFLSKYSLIPESFSFDAAAQGTS